MSSDMKILKRCKITVVNKSDMTQVVPPEFTVNDLKSWKDKTIQRLIYRRGGRSK